MTYNNKKRRAVAEGVKGQWDTVTRCTIVYNSCSPVCLVRSFWEHIHNQKIGTIIETPFSKID